jgi:hypothetical protein
VAFDFEKRLVYQKSVDFVDQVCARIHRVQRGYGFLVDQHKAWITAKFDLKLDWRKAERVKI